MSEPLIISVIFLVFSSVLLVVSFLIPYKKFAQVRKFLRICTLIYVSGTLLVLTISAVKPEVPLIWVWLCEIFAFLIFVFCILYILYIVKKFAEGLKPTASQKTK